MSPTLTLQPLDIPGLLRRNGLYADKRLGQNFLIDESALHKVVEAAGVGPEDRVLEIGAGLGSLTRHLAVCARQVVTVELDERPLPMLKQVLEPFPNVQLVPGDILSLDPSSFFPEMEENNGYIVAANIPYYITSAVIRRLLSARQRPRRLALTVQREVAERICAAPGDLSLLALSVQVYGKPSVAARIPAGAFYPPPKVDSAVVRVELYSTPLLPEAQLEIFFQLARAGFGQKRKTLRNALNAGLPLNNEQIGQLLKNAEIDPQRRAETLSLAEWARLTALYIK